MTEWVKISDIEKARTMAMAANGIMPLSAEDIPDTHTITVSERTISVDNSEIIQNNIKTDLIELVLDGEWYDCGSVYVTLGRSAGYDEPVKLEWKGTALTFPAQLGTEVGGIDVSVVGYGNDGEMRLVTKASSNTFRVVASGYVEGVPPTEESLDILAQIIKQGDAAEAAAEAANTAATSATSAASSANSAASSANTAASSANSAATKANSAAVDAQNAYDTLQPYMATIDSCANILHREVGPDSVVTADDSFPCKAVEMVVYGNTVQNLWVNPSGTINGVTVTSNDDGSVTVSGTSTGTISLNSGKIYTLKPSTKYTVSVDKALSSSNIDPSNGCFFIEQHDSSGANVSDGTRYIGYGTTLSTTFTTSSELSLMYLGVFAASGKTLSGTYRVMLNEGSTAEPWCPPGLNSVGDGGSVKVVTAGKNLLPPYNSDGAIFGVTATSGTDGSVVVSGTSQNSSAFGLGNGNIPNWQLLCGKTVSISIERNNYLYCQLNYIDSGGKHVPLTSESIGSSSVVPENDISNMYYFIGVRKGFSGTVTLHPQLEIGSSATEKEMKWANITTTPIDLQGHTLNALPDGTRDELHIDGGGNVVLEKRVHREHIDASELQSNHPEFCEMPITEKYRDGTMFNSTSQRNDFAPVDNADNTRGYPVASVYTMTGRSAFRVGDGTAQTSAQAQLASVKAKVGAKGIDAMWALLEPQTIDLGTITPPTMGAPNVTAYVADDTPAEMSLDYVRDVNIVHARLEERVAALELASATS